MSAEKPREIAVRLLKRHAEGAGWIDQLLDDQLTRSALSGPDRGLLHELVFGVIRWQGTLDWLIAQKTNGRTQKPVLQILLRLGLYQVFWLDRIPDHAAVHETVELARRLGFGPQSGFINAVLRGFVREKATVCSELETLKGTRPDVGYSHPEWLCARWEKRWGRSKLQSLLEWNNSPPSVFIRVNTLKTTPDALARQFESEEVRFEPLHFDWVPRDLVFKLKEHPALPTLPSFQQGLFYVQDPSTLLAVRELDPQPGESVLDLCSAPGGKTSYAAQWMRNEGTLLAEEPDPKRAKMVAENCARLGAMCVRFPDSSVQPTRELFDRILIDAPCSNTGVMRRRVELRWRIQPAEIERLRGVQLTLLEQSVARLKPQGVLLYSTCSLEPEENDAVGKEFLARHPEFRLDTQRELLPFEHAVDGAFVARFKRS